MLTIAAFVDGISRTGIAARDRIWIETWRTFAYVMFAGLFALLALRPRNSPALFDGSRWGGDRARRRLS
jgi:hypothetical protein